MIFTVQVGSSTVRPIIVDQHFSWVAVSIPADPFDPKSMHAAEIDATLLAFEIATVSRKNIQMITSLTIIGAK
jgi:hypothetical protein